MRKRYYLVFTKKLKQFRELNYKEEVQAKKSTGRMPWHQEPKKDVTSCDKPRGAANKLRSGDFRMGKPTRECNVK